MASKNALTGTGVALAGLGGLAAAAITVGAPEAATPLQPAADTVETQTQTVTTVEHRTKRLRAERSADGRVVVRAAHSNRGPGRGTATPVVAATQAATVSQSAPAGGDDRGETEAGDDHGDEDDSSGHGGDDGIDHNDD